MLTNECSNTQIDSIQGEHSSFSLIDINVKYVRYVNTVECFGIKNTIEKFFFSCFTPCVTMVFAF